MGNTDSNHTDILIQSQQSQDWLKVEDMGYCELWMNKKTGKRCQAYPISNNVIDDTQQIEKYAFRKAHSSNLVAAQGIIQSSDAFLCSQPRSSFVLIQNITARLGQRRGLSFEQALYTLSASSAGYNTLNSFFGPLEPSEDMICINDQGRVKVWLNQNLSKNEPSPTARSLQISKSEGNQDCSVAKRRIKECVGRLFKIVQGASIRGFPQQFRQDSSKLATYFQTVNYVEDYCVKNGIRMPDFIPLQQPVYNNVPSQHFSHQLKNVTNHQIQPNRNHLQTSRVNMVYKSNYTRENPVTIAPLTPIFENNRVYVSPHPNQPIIQRQIITQCPSNKNLLNNFPQTQPGRISFQLKPATYNSQQSLIIHRPIISQSNPKSSEIPNYIPQNVVVNNKVTNVAPQAIFVTGQIAAKQNIQIIDSPQGNIKQIQSVVHHIQKSPQKQPQHQHIQQQQKGFFANTLQNLTNLISPEQKIEHQEPMSNIAQNTLNLQSNLQSHPQCQVQQPQQQHINIEQQHFYQQKSNNNSEQQVSHEDNDSKNCQQYYQQNYHHPVEQTNYYNSQYSNIQEYVAPRQQISLKSPILEQDDSYTPSPSKIVDNGQISEWENKLNMFSMSGSKPVHEHSELHKPIHECENESKDPQSRKQIFQSVGEAKQNQYVNQMHNLDHDDIQKYIRMKYQHYIQEPGSSDYKQTQKQAGYSYNSNTYSPEPVSYKWQTKQYEPVENKYYKYESKQNYQPYKYEQRVNLTSNQYNYDYGNRESAQNQYQIDNQTYTANYAYQQQKPIPRKNSERNKYRPSQTTNIDQKYSKYVLNSQKPRPSLKGLNSKDVSVILAVDDSKVTKMSPIPFLNRSELSQEDYSKKSPAFQLNAEYEGGSKKGITYDKLRNLLWQE